MALPVVAFGGGPFTQGGAIGGSCDLLVSHLVFKHVVPLILSRLVVETSSAR